MDQQQPIMTNTHIECTPGVCGGKPCVSGTRIRVWDIHIWHDFRGLSPEEIVVQFPQLSLADVHSALAYFLDHREEIEQQMQRADQLVEKFQTEQGPTKFSQLRDAILQDKESD